MRKDQKQGQATIKFPLPPGEVAAQRSVSQAKQTVRVGASCAGKPGPHRLAPLGTSPGGRGVLFLASLALLLTTTALAQTGPATQSGTQPAEADLPVRKVTLFSSGVGYFEHAGTVEGESSAVLSFKTEQINDLLKSLVLQDMDGGSVRTVTYPSNDPIERQLGSFQIDLSGAPDLANLLTQLRGAKLTLDNNNSGTVLGVEKKTVADGDTTVEKTFLNLFTGTGIKSIPVDTIGTFTLDDPRLQSELARALDALANARDKDKKSVGFEFAGEGQRRVRLGYVVQAPIWKTSYRLLLGEGEDEESNANLQGWAIVENQTDNDWTDVDLSLVSGRPISFVMNLYQPLYVDRPLVVPDLFRSLNPQVYDEGIVTRKEMEQLPSSNLRRSGGMGGGLGGGPPASATATAEDFLGLHDRRMDAASSIQSMANAADLGELFEYTVEDVDIARQSSAMLPIVTDPVEAEKVSIYNPLVLEKHPLNGVMVTNTTEKHLLQGPITVFEGGGYAGDARINDVPPGEKRLLSYGVDLKLNVQHEQKPGQNVLLTGKIVDGVLQLTRKLRTTHVYTFQNDTDSPRDVVLEHPYDRDHTLVDTPEPYETTDALRRFRFDVEPGRTDFPIVAERTLTQGQQLTTDIDAAGYIALASQGPLPEKVKEALRKAADLQSQVAQAQRKLAQNQAALTEISEEQGRIRSNMNSVNANSDYYKRLVTKLDEQETQIEKLQEEQDALEADLQAKQSALRDYLHDLDVE